MRVGDDESYRWIQTNFSQQLSMDLTVGANSIIGANIIQILTILSSFDNFDTPIVRAKVPNKYDKKLFM